MNFLTKSLNDKSKESVSIIIKVLFPEANGKSLRMLINSIVRTAHTKGFTCYFVEGGPQLADKTYTFYRKWKLGVLETKGKLRETGAFV